MRFFYEEGQPAVRAAAVVIIDKGMHIGRQNYPTIEFQTIDLEEAVIWKYANEQERDETFKAILLGSRTLKVP